jgi:L-threonylcarbamoyladenylate synthase
VTGPEINKKMIRLSLHKKTEKEVLAKALRILKSGGIVAYPTESFYALGVMALNEEAVKKLYLLKKRPPDKAMPVIIGSSALLKTMVTSIPPQAVPLMERFWPGPLTLVFHARENLPELLLGGTKKIAIRIPGDSFALVLARTAGFPITATSANLSGSMPSQRADEVLHYFGENVDIIVEQEKTPGGKPSTIADVTVDPPKVIREGSISLDVLNTVR